MILAIKILFDRPQPKQKEFMEATEKYVGYGGARGGGKSWALRRKLVILCVKHYGIRVLLLRRTFAEVKDNHLRPLRKELPDSVAVYREIDKSFHFANGSVLRFGYCDSEDDVDQYQGQEYDIIALDEATQFTEYQFQTLKACVRGVNY